MELHRDQVPGREVWAVVTESAWGRDIEWFITAQTSSDDYRQVADWWSRAELLDGVTLTRWYIELPRQRMDWEDVDSWVEFILNGDELERVSWRRRLDYRRFDPSEAEAVSG